MMLKADFHAHSRSSPDSLTSIDQLISACIARGINCLALTDHNRVQGALELRRRAPFKVIIGEEIKTSQGEIIGLFLSEEIPRGLSAVQTIEAIRQQGGVVYVPHPADPIRRTRLRPEVLREVAPLVDVLEVCNARSFNPFAVPTAMRFAERHGLLKGAGSDAHMPIEIGNAHVIMPDFDGPEGFLKSLAQGRVVCGKTNPVIHGMTVFVKLRKRIIGRRWQAP